MSARKTNSELEQISGELASGPFLIEEFIEELKKVKRTNPKCTVEVFGVLFLTEN